MELRMETKRPQGFATMSPEKQREIASKGGKTSHANGTAHKWDSASAREAGRKGHAARGRMTDEERYLRRKRARIGGQR